MRHVLKLTFGLLVLWALAVLSVPADAQTTANGPYYATPSWDQKLQCDTQATCRRFIVLSNWNSEAALDRETGLVWLKSPKTDIGAGGNDPLPWSTARFNCAGRSVGGRKGWRLPSINELASLIDPSVPPPGPTLPAGHPFTNVQSSSYWSASTDADDSRLAWFVDFFNGGPSANFKGNPNFLWCVRGGGVLDNY